MSNADEIRKLKELLDEGVITPEEFKSQKDALLGSEHGATPAPPLIQPVKPKKKKKGCLWVFAIVFAAFAIILAQTINKDIATRTQDSDTKESILAFDEKAWSDYVTLITSHNNLLNAIGEYSFANELDVYDYCKEYKVYFSDFYKNLDYGKTKLEKQYLDTIRTMALADQMVADATMQYLESYDVSDLSKLKENVQYAKDAMLTVAGNRAVLLTAAGMTPEEIQAYVADDLAELETIIG